MRWTKRKQMLESLLCDSLQGRIQINRVVYRQSHDQPSRLTITFDKNEIFATDDISYEREAYRLGNHMERSEEMPSLDERYRFMMDELSETESLIYQQRMEEANDKVEETLHQRGLYADHTIYDFFNYNQFSIEEAMNHRSEVIRAYAMLDRRLGMRKLQNMNLHQEHPLVQKFYAIRKTAENLS
ncbi:SF0329 family protein [Macrococcus bovicus]|uniref:Uncharacterized protein n=1 Tax=Macrococcus bovicus TaxID=69968 RepID=A0A4R6BW90_9STAP|nr:hypothetical protein [Macrococcus bovicus]TDM12458.1 hypothetical protein ERX55_10650 [Macrococcus bovicus]